MTAIVKAESPDASGLERVLVQGDLSKLTPDQRVVYYERVCESLGLNPLTRPFEYLSLNGKTVLYAKRDCSDQLRKIHTISIKVVSRETVGDLCIVTTQATTPSGRTDESIGAVTVAGLKGENLANALMKADTKAKRRVTLSICGLGMLDESEVPSGGFDAVTGEVTPLHHQLPRVSGAHSPHDDGEAYPDPDHGRYVDLLDRMQKGETLLAKCFHVNADPKHPYDMPGNYDNMMALRAYIGTPKTQSPLTKDIQTAVRDRAINADQHKELSAIWQSVHRKLDRLEKATPAPSAEASFIDDPDPDLDADIDRAAEAAERDAIQGE